MKRKLLLTLVTALAIVGNAVGQTTATLTENFTGLTANTNYQDGRTISADECTSGLGWEIVCGNVSTTSAIDGNSVLLRSYKTTSSYNSTLGYVRTTTAIKNLTAFSFYAKSTKASNEGINVQTSTDGSTWTNISGTSIVTLTTTAKEYSYKISDDTSDGLYVRVIVAAVNTATTNTDYIFDDFVFTYVSDGETTVTVAAPTISSTTNEDGSVTVTISADDEATIYYTTDGSTPSTTSTPYTKPFTVDASCTVNAIAVNSDGETSSTASETISFPVAGIRGIRDAILEGETSGTVTLSNAVVTYVSGNYNYIQDGTSPDNGAGIVLYKSSTGLKAGQTISGTMSWSGGTIYNGLSEITALGYTDLGEGTVPTAYEVSASTLAADIEKYESYYIKVPGLSISDATVATSSNVTVADNVSIRNSSGSTMTVVADTEATFTGYTYNYGYGSNDGTTATLYIYSQDNISQTGSYTLSAEYGTFYSTYGIFAPSEVKFGIVPSVSNSVLEEDYYTAGDEIPAQTGLLVNGTAGTYSFQYVNFPTAETPENNLLHGADALDANGNTSVDGTDVKYYYLTKGDDGNMGFYWGATDGGAFAFNYTDKAFLAVEGTSAVRGFSLGDATTGITTVETSTSNNSNAVIYNLAGQRVSKATKGVYIQNGRKFVVK